MMFLTSNLFFKAVLLARFDYWKKAAKTNQKLSLAGTD